jgi:hypothetical protein
MNAAKASILSAVLFVAVVLPLVVYGMLAFLSLWSLNTLFGLGIAYTVENLVAGVILVFIIAYGRIINFTRSG